MNDNLDQGTRNDHNQLKWLIKNTEWACVFVLLLLAAYVRLAGLSRAGLNILEVQYWVRAKESIFTNIFVNVYPPLYSLLEKTTGWLGVELGARIVSAISGILFCALLWKMTRKSFGPKVALLTLFFAAAAPQMIRLSRLGLPYQLFALLALLMLLAYLKMAQSPTVRNILLYSAASVAAFYSFYFAIVPWGFFLAASFLMLRKDTRTALKMLAAQALVLLLWIPSMLGILSQMDRVVHLQAFFVYEAGIWAALRGVLSLFLRSTPAVAFSLIGKLIPVVSSLLLLIFGGGLMVLGYLGGKKNQMAPPSSGFFLSYFLFCSIFSMILHWSLRVPTADHYFVFLMVVSLPFAANACYWPKKKIFIVLMIALLIFGNFVAIRKIPNPFISEVRDGIRWINEKVAPGDSLTLAFGQEIENVCKVYGVRELETVAIPADLPGYKTFYPEQHPQIVREDRAAFNELVQGRSKIFVLVGEAKIDTGRGLVDQWLSAEGFKVQALARFKGGEATLYSKIEPAMQKNPEKTY